MTHRQPDRPAAAWLPASLTTAARPALAARPHLVLQLSGAALLAALVTNQLGLLTNLGVIASIGQIAMSSMAVVMVVWLVRGWRRVPAALGMLGCLAGDLAPWLVGGDAAPLAMIGAFALGQVFLVDAFWKSVDWHAGTTQTLALLLVVMALSASGSRWGLAGGLLFVVSDSLLAMRLLPWRHRTAG